MLLGGKLDLADWRRREGRHGGHEIFHRIRSDHAVAGCNRAHTIIRTNVPVINRHPIRGTDQVDDQVVLNPAEPKME